MDPAFYREHLRRFTAAGAEWIVSWDGADIEAARREIRGKIYVIETDR